MRQITGNKLLVRALKEEGVDTISDIRERVRLILAMSYTDKMRSK